MEKTITSYEELISDLHSNIITMVAPEHIGSLLRLSSEINKIEGDILECGVWRGGVSIFLSHLFSNKNVWVSDSFRGFQPLSHATYEYDKERHTPEYTQCHIGPIGISLDEVKNNFKAYSLEEDINSDRIKFLEGFVKDTLPTSGIEKLALLRIDVDAYSATLEVLDEMYDKVRPGGYIVFDDSCLYEVIDALKVFFKQKNLENYIYHPITDEKLDIYSTYTNDNSGFPSACYIIKK